MFIEVGKGGWNSEIEADEEKNIVRDLQRVFKGKHSSLQIIADVVPQSKRHAIVPLDWDADFMEPAVRESD